MSVVINTNVAASIAANNLAYSIARLQDSLGKLSTGSKIVNPSDDAGGLAVSMKLTAAANRDSDIQDNLSDTTSYAQTQDGALQVAGSILDRMSQLVTLYSDPTKNSSDQANYNDEFTQIQAELTSLGSETFNGISLFGTGSLSVDTTDDLSSAAAVSVSQQNLLDTGGFTNFTDPFANLSDWTTSGTVSAGGGDLNLSGSDVDSTATTTTTFGAPLQINLRVQIPGTGDTFTIAHGSDVLDTLVGAGNVSRGSHNVQIDIDSSGTATTYLDGSSTPFSTVTGVSTAAGSISLSDIGAGPAIVKNFSVTNTGASSNLGAVAAASDLGGLSLSSITGAIQEIGTMRANNGAEQSRLSFASSLVTTNRTNLQSAVSNITDVNVATETTSLAKWNVLVQAGTSMLSQANLSSQVALKLITG